MAIVGIGTDLVEIDRIEATLKRHPERFPERILSPEELQTFANHALPHRYLAKRFAAKEAGAKALGTGIRRNICFTDFVVSNGKDGNPMMQLRGCAAEKMAELGGRSVHLSLSDERHFAQAFVIIES